MNSIKWKILSAAFVFFTFGHTALAQHHSTLAQNKDGNGSSGGGGNFGANLRKVYENSSKATIKSLFNIPEIFSGEWICKRRNNKNFNLSFIFIDQMHARSVNTVISEFKVNPLTDELYGFDGLSSKRYGVRITSEQKLIIEFSGSSFGKPVVYPSLSFPGNETYDYLLCEAKVE